MKTNQPLITRRLLPVAACLLAASQLQAQINITGGDLYVYQAGDGTTAVAASGAAPVYIDQFSTAANGLIAQTALPTTTGFGSDFLAGGQSATDGSLSYDPVGNALVFGGYSGPAVGTASIQTTASGTANRDIGTVNASGTFSFAVQNSAQYGNGTGGSGTLRGAATDGSGNYWASGTSGNGGGVNQGVWYYGNNASAAQLTPTSLASRSIQIYGGNLYYTSGSGVSMISGEPQSGLQTSTLLTSGLGGTPYGFVFNPSMTVLYIANEAAAANSATGGGIQRWNYNGTSWVFDYTITAAGSCDWVTADFSGANPEIYATTFTSATGNKLVQITDDGTLTDANASETALDSITGSSTDEANYDGIVFVPAPEPSIYALAGLGLVMLSLGKLRRMRNV